MTVLRDGHHVVTQSVADVTPDQVIRQMIGREIEDHSPQHLAHSPSTEILRVEDLSSPGKFSNINFTIHAGEVLGFGGLIGAGRSEIAQAVFGLDPHATGRIFIHGQPLPLGNASKSMAAGIGLLPEDRKRQGLVLTMNCRENTSLAALDKCAPLGWIDPSRESDIVHAVTHRLRVKTPSLETPIAGLSGGNQQKLALAKWLLRECRLLIVDEPTRGVDVGAKAEIHRLLDELAVQGIAIWLISSELPELMRLSRRILVLREGHLRAEVQREDFSEAHLMRHMAGLGAH
jgi:ABC-type sugar transport system ATPase subunit